MHIKGWAYTPDEQERCAANQKRFRELHDLNEYVVIDSFKAIYARHVYHGHIKPGGLKITPEDLAVYLDRGNVCFGGECIIASNGAFKCEIYTD